MQALRNYRLRRSWQQLGDRPAQRPKASQRWGSDARVLVLYDGDDPETVQRVRKLSVRDLGLTSGADRAVAPVSALAWTAAPQAEAARATDVWSPKQLNFAGVARPEVMQPVLAKAYDLVLNLYPAPFAPFDFLCAQTTAHLRIARHDGARAAYDVMIDGSGSAEGFLRAVTRYLGGLNPNAT